MLSICGAQTDCTHIIPSKRSSLIYKTQKAWPLCGNWESRVALRPTFPAEQAEATPPVSWASIPGASTEAEWEKKGLKKLSSTTRTFIASPSNDLPVTLVERITWRTSIGMGWWFPTLKKCTCLVNTWKYIGSFLIVPIVFCFHGMRNCSQLGSSNSLHTPFSSFTFPSHDQGPTASKLEGPNIGCWQLQRFSLHKIIIEKIGIINRYKLLLIKQISNKDLLYRTRYLYLIITCNEYNLRKKTQSLLYTWN